MSNINTIPTNNIITVIPVQNNIVIVTDSDQNQVVVTQPSTQVIEVSTPGPRGEQGPPGIPGPSGSGGDINTGSLVTTSSFNDFTSSINNFTSSYYIDSASFNSRIISNSSSIASLYASYNTGSFTGSFSGSLSGISTTASYVLPLTQSVVIKGTGTTSATTALTVQNTNASASFIVRDDGNVYANGSGFSTTNTVFGLNALISNVSGTGVTAVGYQALRLSTGNQNTAFGALAGNAVTIGTDNNALGYQALYNTNVGSNNVAIGRNSLLNNQSGSANIAIGNYTLAQNLAFNNVAIGHQAANQNTTGTGIVAIGHQAATANISGTGITVLGYQAAYNSTTANNITIVGYQAGFSTTGGDNTTVGFQSLYANTGGIRNVAMGTYALFSNVSGNENVAIGRQALYANKASGNTALGSDAAKSNTTGTGVTAIGYQALLANTGSNNTALGYQAGYAITTGTGNTLIGSSNGNAITIGSSNTLIGASINTSGAGSNNVGIGWAATANGGNSVVIGYSASNAGFNGGVILGRAATATADNQFVVGSSTYNAGTVTTTGLLIGPSSSWAVKVNGTDYTIPVAQTSSAAKLQIVSTGTTSATTTLRVENANASASLVVLDNGFIGVGTTSPSASLHISGSSGSVLLEIDSDLSQNILFVSGSGNVGIGTSTPEYKVAIQTSTVNDGLLLKTSQNLGYLAFTNGNSESFPVGRISLNYGSTNAGIISVDSNRLTLRGGYTTGGSISFSSVSTEIARITNIGLGVGVTSPTSRLQVRGSGATSSTTSFLVENTNASASMVVLDNGNVGIGTSTPTASLDINGTTRITPPLNNTGLTISGYSITGSNDQSVIDISGSWDTTGTPTLIKANITNTTSNASSLLMDLQVSGSSQFRVNRVGLVRAVSGYSIGSANSNDLSPTDGGPISSTTGLYTGLRFGGSSTSGFGLTISGFNTSTRTNTTGVAGVLSLEHGFAPTSGTGAFIGFRYIGTINQTGGANGVTRGVHVNPTITAAADWRSIEWGNSTGWGLYGVGTASNYLNGSLLIGTTTNTGTSRLQVRGSGTTSATTTLRVENSNASASLVVLDNGFIGVGTTSPSASLHISGSSGSALLKVDSDSSQNILFVSGSGNIGIGTSTPDRLVHINSTVGNALRIDNVGGGQNAIFIGNVSSLIRWSNGSYFSNTGMYSVTSDQQYITFDGTNTQVRLQIKASDGNISIGTTGSLARLQVRGSGTTSGTTALLVQNSNASSSLSVLDDGAVGIGTSNPQFKLDVYGNYHQYQVQGLLARYDITTANANQNRGVWDFYTNAAVTPDFFGRFGFKFEGGTADSFKQFQVHIADSTIPKFVVDGSGRAGIGTITPSASLHISGSSGSVLFKIDSNSTQNVIYVSGSGNIGIGTRLPTTHLDVSGSGRFTNNLTITGSLIAPSITGSLQGTSSISVTESKTITFNLGSIPTPISTGSKSNSIFYSSYSGSIKGFILTSNTGSNTVLSIWKKNNDIPTLLDNISIDNKPTLTGNQFTSSYNISNWSSSFIPNDIFLINVESNNSSSYLSLQLITEIYK